MAWKLLVLKAVLFFFVSQQIENIFWVSIRAALIFQDITLFWSYTFVLYYWDLKTEGRKQGRIIFKPLKKECHFMLVVAYMSDFPFCYFHFLLGSPFILESTFIVFSILVRQGWMKHNLFSFFISHFVLSLVTLLDMPMPQVLEQGVQGVACTRHFFFKTTGKLL